MGTLVGLEIPLVMRILKRELAFKDLVSQVLTFDYLGALAVSILFPLILAPHLGMVRTGLMFGVLNVAVALWALHLFREQLPDAIEDFSEYFQIYRTLDSVLREMAQKGPVLLRPLFEAVISHTIHGRVPMRYELVDGRIVPAKPYEGCSGFWSDDQRTSYWAITTHIHICQQTKKLFMCMIKKLRIHRSSSRFHQTRHSLNEVDV